MKPTDQETYLVERRIQAGYEPCHVVIGARDGWPIAVYSDELAAQQVADALNVSRWAEL